MHMKATQSTSSQNTTHQRNAKYHKAKHANAIAKQRKNSLHTCKAMQRNVLHNMGKPLQSNTENC